MGFSNKHHAEERVYVVTSRWSRWTMLRYVEDKYVLLCLHIHWILAMHRSQSFLVYLLHNRTYYERYSCNVCSEQ